MNKISIAIKNIKCFTDRLNYLSNAFSTAGNVLVANKLENIASRIFKELDVIEESIREDIEKQFNETVGQTNATLSTFLKAVENKKGIINGT